MEETIKYRPLSISGCAIFVNKLTAPSVALRLLKEIILRFYGLSVVVNRIDKKIAVSGIIRKTLTPMRVHALIFTQRSSIIY